MPPQVEVSISLSKKQQGALWMENLRLKEQKQKLVEMLTEILSQAKCLAECVDAEHSSAPDPRKPYSDEMLAAEVLLGEIKKGN